MKRLQCFVIIVWAMAGTLCAQDNTEPNFWFLEQGTEPTAENRINAIKNVGRGLLDFAIYQPTGSTFSEEYRQKLTDAGFVFDFLTEEQLAQTNHNWATYHFSPVGRVSVLVIPESVAVPMEEIERLRALAFVFLGKAPELPESVSQRGVISLADRKNEIEAGRQRMRERLAASPNFANSTAEEIEAILHWVPEPISPIGAPTYKVMDQVGDNLAEAVGLFTNRARTFSENFVADADVKLLARRALTPGVTMDSDAVDVFYVFANTKENAEPIDGWFQLQELKGGRSLGHISLVGGGGGFVLAQPDRAFIMDPATGKIGRVALHNIRAFDRNDWYMRIQMKPEEMLVVRIVRERARSGSGPPAGAGFQEFESLPDWEYEGEVPEPPGR